MWGSILSLVNSKKGWKHWKKIPFTKKSSPYHKRIKRSNILYGKPVTIWYYWYTFLVLQSRSIIVRSIIVRFLAIFKKIFKNADILDNYGTNSILVFKEEWRDLPLWSRMATDTPKSVSGFVGF